MNASPPPAIESCADRFNFASHVLTSNAARAGKAAYIDDRRTLRFGQLEREVKRFAAGLLSRGLHREQRLLLVMQDTVEWPVAFLGCLHAGIVPVAVNTLLPVIDYGWMLRHSGARAICVSASLAATLDAARKLEGLASIPMIIAGDTASASILNTLRFDDLPVETFAAETLETAPTHRDDIAFWLYSSGSTGRPKGAVHTHGNLFSTQATYGRHVLGLVEDDITFSAAKLFFAYGLGNSLTFPLCVGATVLLMAERATPDAVIDRLVRHRPSVFFGVPTLYANMLASPAMPHADQLALRRCLSAGEALPRDVGERFQAQTGAPILDGIGSTEMLHIFLSNRADALRYGTSGQPVPGYELRLLDESGAAVADGEIGELLVKGESHALMYWTEREKSRATFQGAWLRTGDRYRRDAEGWYVYAGRGDDMLKVSGQYVSPFEVESALMLHASVLEAALIGMPDDSGLTKSKGYVVLRPGHTPSEALAADIRVFLKERLVPHKVPKAIEFIDELPKTPTGKIQRFRLRERELASR